MPRIGRAPGAAPEPVKRTAVRVHARPAAPWAAEAPKLEWKATLPGRISDPDLAWAPWLVAENAVGRWTVQQTKFEAVAVCEPRECGRPRHELGRFRSVAAAVQACEADHQRRLALRAAEAAEPAGLVSIEIGGGVASARSRDRSC